MADLRVVLELRPDVIPRGRLIAGGGEAVPFAGWIGLSAALERVLAAANSRSSGLSRPTLPE